MKKEVILSQNDKSEILEYFNTMEFPPAKESNVLVTYWLKEKENQFSSFIGNAYVKHEPANLFPVLDSFTNECLANVSLPTENTVQLALLSSSTGFTKWKEMSPIERSNLLHRIALKIEKKAELFAQTESLSSGKHLYRTREKDVPNLIQSFQYYASAAERFHELSVETGIVCVIAHEYNFPLPSISWKIGSLLAAGNAVLLLTNVKSCFSAFLMAEICREANLPSGVFNVLPINKDTFTHFPQVNRAFFARNMDTFTGFPSVSRAFFAGTLEDYRFYNELAAKENVPCEALICRRPVVIVYESADMHEAVNSVLLSLFFSNTRDCSGGCQVFVQDCIQELFLKLLKDKFAKIVVGGNFTKSDMSCMVTENMKQELNLFLEEANNIKSDIVQANISSDLKYPNFKPTLICNVPTTSKLIKERGGPIVVTCPFRSVKESIAMFNHNREGADVSIWSNRLCADLEVVKNLRARTIWLNSENVFDPSVAYCGIHFSGNSVEGGLEPGLRYACKPNPLHSFDINILSNDFQTQGKHSDFSPDLLNAIAAATAAYPIWDSKSKLDRLKVLYKVTEQLKAKDGIETTVAKCIEKVSENLLKWCNYLSIQRNELIDNGVGVRVLQERKSLGVIAIQLCIVCYPGQSIFFLSLMNLLAPAIGLGNSVILVLSGDVYKLIAFQMAEHFHKCGLPKGVLNVVPGNHVKLTRNCVLHPGIDAVWFAENDDEFINKSNSRHMKRLFKYCCIMDQGPYTSLVTHSTYLQSTYLRMGDIFAN